MKKRVLKSKTPIRKSRSRKRNLSSRGTWLRYFFVTFLLLLLCGIAYHYRNGLAYYLGFKSDKVLVAKEQRHFSDVRNYQVLSRHEDLVAGIDVSQYQGTITWSKVKAVEGTFPIRFAFIRSTAGTNKLDQEFRQNWKNSKENGIIRGAYHYYRPNENSIEQANFFISNVTLEKGDLPPILDIESLPKNQSIDSLKVGLKRWLTIVDAKFRLKPIIYTNEKFYEDFLKDDFSEFQFWIANYNFFTETMQDDWLFWQFTEKASIAGIDGNVDVNLYNGSPKMLRYLTKP
ncbi:MAG: glycoside hydrolase family 25 protein [Flavobacterium sp.]|nr:glycoside hydrolase family 25 protein [Flavobacterium sp.]